MVGKWPLDMGILLGIYFMEAIYGLIGWKGLNHRNIQTNDTEDELLNYCIVFGDSVH